jgi:hypothetical protein
MRAQGIRHKTLGTRRSCEIWREETEATGINTMRSCVLIPHQESARSNQRSISGCASFGRRSFFSGANPDLPVCQVHAAARRFFRPLAPSKARPPATPSSAQKVVDSPATPEKLSKVGSFGTAQNRIEPWHPPLFRSFCSTRSVPSFFSQHHHTQIPSQKSSNNRDPPLKQLRFSFPFSSYSTT